MEIEPTKVDPVVLANTTVVRENDGKLSVYVGDTRMMGTINVQVLNGEAGIPTLVLGLPSHRFRFAEGAPARPVYETKDNVITFPLMNAYRDQWKAEAEAELKAEAEATKPPDSA